MFFFTLIVMIITAGSCGRTYHRVFAEMSNTSMEAVSARVLLIATLLASPALVTGLCSPGPDAVNRSSLTTGHLSWHKKAISRGITLKLVIVDPCSSLHSSS
eukprot:TRINITY_DN3797_c0_g1_i3.p2 TRINITY_DN3797_c0_g1~~TRINITY_DN3797_c0_g1_i3.p2  ORF type:complete len:102 (-),score=3.60 TRINITY_DN3797_c0_g1_i3:252-557(-)